MTTATSSRQFHVLSFEGPDPYSLAGGLGSRVKGLTESLAEQGDDSHLWFVGDPDLPGHEQREHLHLHRWCQWLSRHHGGGVYDGEHAKVEDYSASIPRYMMRFVLGPHLRGGGQAVVLAEEWHTVGAVLGLDQALREQGLRDRVRMFWNANNTFGFDFIDWAKLSQAATVTTVSRYMKYLMQPLGVDPLVIPNGLPAEAFAQPERDAVTLLKRRFKDRLVLTKMARWDPDKRWLASVHIAADLKRRGWRPLLVARGGSEAHGHEVMGAVRKAGLRTVDRWTHQPGEAGLMAALRGLDQVDVVNLRSRVDADARRVLFRASDTVLANSAHEPFGLVGLEAMAVGGIACTGCSGEDYAIAGRNALVLQTDEPAEFSGLFGRLRGNPGHMRDMRRAGRRTARHYAWSEVIQRNLLPTVELNVQ